jgi:DNA polymerase
MQTLAIDIETYSSADLKKSGVYKYVEAPDFEILLLAYRLDDGPVKVIDLTKGPAPLSLDRLRISELVVLLTDPTVLKTAHSAAFERACIAKYFGITLPPEQWECTLVKATMLGLPAALEMAAKALSLDAQKDSEGKALIKYFCVPCKPTKANGGRTRNLPEHDPEKWSRFIEYNRQDVVVEQSLRQSISFFEIPEQERRLWHLDQRVNDRGILLEPQFVHNAIRLDAEYRQRLEEEAITLTGLANPNSAAQLKAWLSEALDMEVDKLRKGDIPTLLKASDSCLVDRVLTIRAEMSKTSVKKYEAMRSVICKDNRARGLLQFYGANRTGRWAGRLVQVQNLPQNHLADLDLARKLVQKGDCELLEMMYGNVPDTLSQLIRTAFIAPEGSRFLVADFSAIEARVIAWLAGEKWRLDVFNTHGKIYEASAAQMFKVPIESVTKGSDLRQKGKVSELALGYQGGPNALISMGALKMGLKEEELPALVKMWRNANKQIVKLWYDVEEAAVEAVETGEPRCYTTQVNGARSLYFHVSGNWFYITLPSGRKLSYLKPTLVPNKFGGNSLCYLGVDQTTKAWRRIDTYGGKLVENIVQAIARDCLAYAMLNLDTAGYKIVMHVHDEIVAEMPEGCGSLEEINAIMGQPIPWAKGLPLKADSYETNYYKKD